jgi:hypothetical protein
MTYVNLVQRSFTHNGQVVASSKTRVVGSVRGITEGLDGVGWKQRSTKKVKRQIRVSYSTNWHRFLCKLE